MDRLSPLDSFFLFIEDGTTHMHIASCAVFEGPAPTYACVEAAIASRLAKIPRYRQRVRFVPLQLGRPVWVDDPHFQLGYHLRHTALPAPGGDSELRVLMGRLMSQELDRHRPLWEAWMVEGLDAGRWALITKVHHCMADGISGMDLLAAILDPERGAARDAAAAAAWRPAPEPSGVRLVADAICSVARAPYDQLRTMRGALGAPRAALARVRDVTGGALSYARRIPPTAPNSLVGGIGPHRRWTWTTATLDDVRTIRSAFGGTVNDVVVAAVTGGLRELLLDRAEPVEGLVLRALVPVSLRSDGDHGRIDNRVSAMFADLPIAVVDPVDRYHAVREQLAVLKNSHQAIAGEELTTWAGLAPSTGLAFTERAAMQLLRRVPQHTINTVTTNIPGPQFPLYLAGRELLDLLPFVPITSGMRVGVAILSYNGRLAFGVTADYDAVADVEVVAKGIDVTLAELLQLATT